MTDIAYKQRTKLGKPNLAKAYPAGCESVTELLAVLRASPIWHQYMIKDLLSGKITGAKANLYCDTIKIWHTEIETRIDEAQA